MHTVLLSVHDESEFFFLGLLCVEHG
jgi:hypothetical protein